MALHAVHPKATCTEVQAGAAYFLSLRRCTRVLRSNLRCFFLDMRLRRFLMTEPMLRSFT